MFILLIKYEERIIKYPLLFALHTIASFYFISDLPLAFLFEL